MVKILFAGDVSGNWQLLFDRLNELQNSRHGPFDILFLTGNCCKNDDDYNSIVNWEPPLHVYCIDNSIIKKYKDIQLPNNFEILTNDNNVGIINIYKSLTVSYILSSNNSIEDMEKVKAIASSTGYRGCDVLISDQWPRGMHHFLQDKELEELKSSTIGLSAGVQAVSDFAMIVKPRYHLVSGMNAFFQRSPYSNIDTTTSNNNKSLAIAYTRLISISNVSPSKEKSKKWMHAISISPIIQMSSVELAELPPGITDCPYLSIGVKRSSSAADSSDAKRIRSEDSNANSGAFFFGDKGISREDAESTAKKEFLTPPSDTACTLFIGGLNNANAYDLKKFLQGAQHVSRPAGKSFAFVDFVSHNAAKKVVETATRKGLVFKGQTLKVGWSAKSKEEHVKKQYNNTDASNDKKRVHYDKIIHSRILEPPSDSARSLFIGGLPTHLVDVSINKDTTDSNAEAQSSGDSLSAYLESELLKLFPNITAMYKNAAKPFLFVDFTNQNDAKAVIEESYSNSYKLDGKILTIGWCRDDALKSAKYSITVTPPSDDCKVVFLGNLDISVTDNEILELFINFCVESVKRPEGKAYAFIDFTTPEQARDAVNYLCNKYKLNDTSNDNSNESSSGNDDTEGGLILGGRKVSVGWAKGQAADDLNQSSECWFCLASPKVKTHLIVSVGEHCYLALPRGGISDHHILVCPIDCVPSRVHMSTDARNELVKFQNNIELMFTSNNMVSIRYERALRTTNSRDHMQLHMVALEHHYCNNDLLSLFLQKANQLNIKFHEIQGTDSVDEIVVSMEGGPYQEYFYIEIPIMTNDNDVAYKRFVYVKEEKSDNYNNNFPMQFGPELVAEIIGKPERSHWKHCLLKPEEEQQLTDTIRSQFAPHDFTL